MIRRAAPHFIFLLALLVSGCAPLWTNDPRTTRETLAAASYAAADALMQQSRTTVKQDTRLQIDPLSDMDSPSERTAFGQMVAQQISARFVQLGFNVAASYLDGAPPQSAPQNQADNASYGANPYGSYPAADTGNSSALIMGQYAAGKNQVFINLRVVEPASGRVMAAYDYAVPRTADIRELMRSSADKNSSLFGF